MTPVPIPFPLGNRVTFRRTHQYSGKVATVVDLPGLEGAPTGDRTVRLLRFADFKGYTFEWVSFRLLVDLGPPARTCICDGITPVRECPIHGED